MGHHNIPFSWEKSPGISKVSHQERHKGVVVETHKIALPPPPCPSDSPKLVGHHLQIPLPPCPFQPSLRFPSKKELKREDPFLAAYLECTRSGNKGGNLYHNKDTTKKKGGSLSILSCKRSCSVREDSLVSLAHVPKPVERERGINQRPNNWRQ